MCRLLGLLDCMGQWEQVLQGFAKPFSSFLIFVQVYQKNGQLKRILLVDNFDSFTYNLVHYLESLHCEVHVCYNNSIPSNVLEDFDGIVLSPGPGLPEESGDLMLFIELHMGKIPILGVCLGMQAIAISLGGELYNQKLVKHGLQEEISVQKGVLFTSDDASYQVGLYHSWGVSEAGRYRVTAFSKSGTVMAVENKEEKCFGLQFHPESVMTPLGVEILKNFLTQVGEELTINAV